MRRKLLSLAFIPLSLFACNQNIVERDEPTYKDAIARCRTETLTKVYDPSSIKWANDEEISESKNSPNAFVVTGSYRERRMTGIFMDFYACVADPGSDGDKWVVEVTTGQMLEDYLEEG